MLQYALLHLFGYKVSMDDIKAFRVHIASAPQLAALLTRALRSKSIVSPQVTRK